MLQRAVGRGPRHRGRHRGRHLGLLRRPRAATASQGAAGPPAHPDARLRAAHAQAASSTAGAKHAALAVAAMRPQRRTDRGPMSAHPRLRARATPPALEQQGRTATRAPMARMDGAPAMRSAMATRASSRGTGMRHAGPTSTAARRRPRGRARRAATTPWATSTGIASVRTARAFADALWDWGALDARWHTVRPFGGGVVAYGDHVAGLHRHKPAVQALWLLSAVWRQPSQSC